MAEKRQPPPGPPPTLLQRVVAKVAPIGCGGLFVAGLVAMIWQSCDTHSGIYEAGDAFFADLKAGRVEAAYRSLATSRRAQLDLEAFRRATDHRVYRSHEEVVLGEVESFEQSTEACVVGTASLPDGEWGLELYLVKEGDAWRVHSFAIQPPAQMQRMHLLEICY
ncbi:MAG TPA: hypothetical protein RMH99_01960 [Sandaracinaceae bacterium LLY-WYZ-13_1]|nr:hypothetical protein [Sandaracinaceae bacterium LLY-WYZ-13_1]